VGSHVNRNSWNQFEDRLKTTPSGDCSRGATAANANNSGQKGVETPAGFEEHLACSDALWEFFTLHDSSTAYQSTPMIRS